jgi:REP element-mobilizing transposase RayT
LAGTTYLVTRRCTQRRFLLRPSANTNGILHYCLALAAQRYHILVHAYCFMSNHFHLVVTDPSAVLPEFMRYLDEMIARAMNAAMGRLENLWASGTYSAVALVDAVDIINKVAYTLANPVTASLVPRSRRWPGVISDTRQVDGPPVTVLRPQGFFRPTGPAPESCALQITRPPGFPSTAAFVEPLEREVRAREDAAAPGPFLGVRAVLLLDPSASPASTEPRRDLKPCVAASDRRCRVEALGRMKEFLSDYREAWVRFRAGVRDVLFPPGTYGLRVRLGVACSLT